MLIFQKRILSVLYFSMELMGFGAIYLFILTLTDGSLEWVRTFLALLS